MKKNSFEIQFVLCPGRYPEKKYTNLYNNIYQCWHDVWSQTFLEIENNPNLKSDNFTRQDNIGAILVDGECKAMSVFKYHDANSPTFERDSYFSNWAETHRQKLSSRGSHILVCSHFTIHPTARKDTLGFSMRDILMGMTTEVFLHSGASAMTGAMRKNRKAHDVAYTWGAVPVAYDIPSGHGDHVDLVAFFEHEVSKTRENNEFKQELSTLWEERIIIEQNLPQMNRFQKVELEIKKSDSHAA